MIYPDLITFWIGRTTYESARRVPSFPRPSYPTRALVRNLDSAATAFLEGTILAEDPDDTQPARKLQTQYTVKLDTRRYRKIVARMSKDFFELPTHPNNGSLKAAIDNYNAGWRAAGNIGTNPPFSLGNFPDPDQSIYTDFIIDRTATIADFDRYGNLINAPIYNKPTNFSLPASRSVTYLLVGDIQVTFPDDRKDLAQRNTRLSFYNARLRQAQTAEDVTNLLFTITASALP